MNISGIEPKLLKILTSSKNLQKDLPFEKYQEVEKIVQSVETYSNEKVEYIDMRNPNDVYVKIKTTSIRLGTLDNTVYERIKRIYTILPQISEVNNKI
jgi:cell division septal protein FtsQ